MKPGNIGWHCQYVHSLPDITQPGEGMFGSSEAHCPREIWTASTTHFPVTALVNAMYLTQTQYPGGDVPEL